MQVAAAVDVTIRIGHKEVADALDRAVGKANHLPVAVELGVPIAVARDEVAIRRVDAVSVEIHLFAAHLMRLLLLADGELDRGMGTDPAKGLFYKGFVGSVPKVSVPKLLTIDDFATMN